MKIFSYNARGLNSKHKRDKIFSHLKHNYKGIYCLQETHVTAETEKHFHNYWGEHCYFSNGTAGSKGVVIIIPKTVDFELHKIKRDQEGRYVMLDGNFNGRNIMLVKIYAPH